MNEQVQVGDRVEFLGWGKQDPFSHLKVGTLRHGRVHRRLRKLRSEIALIQVEREHAHMRPAVNQECRDNFLASLDEWETDLRLQLAEMTSGG